MIHPGNRPSQKESCLPTIIGAMLNFGGVVFVGVKPRVLLDV